MNEILQYALLGLGTAAAYTLLGSGVILISRGSGVINFAQGALALIGALFYYSFNHVMGIPFYAALAFATLLTATLGLIIYILIMRPLASSSVTARTIATLGLFILLQGLAVLVWGVGPFSVQPFLPRGTLEFLNVVISWDRIILILIAVVAILVLWVVARYTATGLAFRAIAENARATSTLGWSPVKLGAITWTLGAGLAGLAGVLIAPITTVTVEGMPMMIVPVLAAVLLAGFKSFPLLLVSSLAIGVGQSLIFNFLPISGMSQSLPFILILIVLIARGRERVSRSLIVERLPMVGTGRVHWIPVGIIVLLIAVTLLFWSNDQFLAAATGTFGWSLIVLSIVILVGYTGQLSLAQATLAAIAGMLAAKFVSDLAMPLPIAVILALITTILVGLVFALPAVRTRGMNLAIVTLGIASITTEFIFKNAFFTGAYGSIYIAEVNLFGLNLTPIMNPEGYAIVALIIFVLGCLMTAAVRRGTAGGRLLAVRTNERAASALGVNVVGAKFYSFGLAAAVAGLGGVILAFQNSAFTPSNFDPMQSITVIAYAFVGGVGFIMGAPAGGQFAPGSFGSWIMDLIWPGASGVGLQILSGVFVILFILLQPDGFARDWVKAANGIRNRLSHKKDVRDDEETRHLKAQLSSEIDPEVVRNVTVKPARLEVDDLTVKFGSVVAVSGVSFAVEPGEVVALIGPNGAGKSTCIDAITGFVSSTGTIKLNGADISKDLTHTRARKGIGRSFQSLELFESLTVKDNLLIGADEGRSRNYFRDLVYPKRPELGPLSQAVIQEFGLADLLDKQVNDLAYGQRRLVAVARAMASEPSVLLLDEPAAGLGDEEKQEFEAVVRKIANWGIAVLLVEHDMGLVMGVSDRVVVMETGKRLAVGTPAEVQRNPSVIAAYLGGDESPSAGDRDQEYIAIGKGESR